MSESILLWQLCLTFLKMSLIAIGGSDAALSAYQYEAVDHYHWMSNETFSQLYATAQLAPGPNITVVTLIGWYVAGIWGAIVATLSMLVPDCVLAYIVGKWASRFIETPQFRLIQSALVPLAIGLFLASGLNLAARQLGHTIALPIIVGGAAYIYYFKTNPIWALLIGVLISLLIN